MTKKKSDRKMVAVMIDSFYTYPNIDIKKTPPLMVTIDKLDNADERPGGRCRMCRYPGRTDAGIAVFCGLPTGGWSSWCSYHRARMTRESRY